MRLIRANTPIDAGTTAEDLANRGTLSDAGGEIHLFDLMDSVPNLANFDYYVKKVIERLERANLKSKCNELSEALDRGDDLESLFSELNSSIETIGRKQFEFLDAKGLIQGDFKQEYLIPGILVKGQPCIVAGPKKCLKTNILLSIAFCLTTANMLFKKFAVPTGYKVGIMSGESGAATIQETFSRISKSYGWLPQSVEGLHICFKLPSLTNPIDLSSIKRYIKENKLDVFIFDPVYLCLNLGDGASNLFLVGDKLKLLTELGQETGCTIIIAHHTRKSNGQNQFAEPELEEIAFAGFQEWARQWILVGRREEYKPDEPGVHKLWFRAGGSAGHNQCWALNINEGSIEDEGGRIWETRLFPAKNARAEKQTEREQRKQEQKEAQAQKDKDNVLRVLESAEGPLTASKVRDKANLPTIRNNVALESLVESGSVISKNMKGRNGRLTDHFSLVAGTAGSSGKEDSLPLSHSTKDRERERSPSIRDLPAPVCESESESEQREDSRLSDDLKDIFPPDNNNGNF
ncbi:MAG: AAA family ATPase [Planctomycetaceae bacterium]|nr:AAA family ATPase [Planctomycetaceae bacterium]